MPAQASQPGRFDSHPVVERLRTLCRALPETSERSSWGHPNFRAGRKTFAAFEIVGGRPSIAFRLPAGEVEELLSGRDFFATPYGRGLWASLWVDHEIDWTVIDRLLRRSYRVVALERMLAAMENAPTSEAPSHRRARPTSHRRAKPDRTDHPKAALHRPAEPDRTDQPQARRTNQRTQDRTDQPQARKK